MISHSISHTARQIAAAAMLVILAMAIGVSAAAADSFGEPEQGRNVYDRADLLTPAEIDNLEELTADVEAAGAPVVVYLQAKDASYDETLQDGRELMDEWDVQSAEDARDGIVIFLNLDPDDLRHGELALVAGEAHFDGGNLPQYELDRITSAMLNELADEQTAEGIATGLRMIADSLETGPPPPPEPSRFEQISEDIAGGMISPLNAVAAVVVAGVAYVWRRVWSARPTTNVPATPVTTPPGDLIPAAAGALVTRAISDTQVEATILDLARRNALAIEPEDGKKKVQVRLTNPDVVENPFEAEVWKALEANAVESGLITSKKLAGVRSKYGPAKDVLRDGMVDRGWFDPDATSRSVPLYIAGGVALLLGLAGFIATVASESPWGIAGTVALGGIGLAGIIAAASYPATTAEGEAEAQPWRGYLKGLKDARKDLAVDIDLDEAVPYLVAMNAGSQLDDRLKGASENGYAPAWLNSSREQATWGAAGFYPYWITFHSVATPTASVGAGGASAGSGGSGGSF